MNEERRKHKKRATKHQSLRPSEQQAEKRRVTFLHASYCMRPTKILRTVEVCTTYCMCLLGIYVYVLVRFGNVVIIDRKAIRSAGGSRRPLRPLERKNVTKKSNQEVHEFRCNLTTCKINGKSSTLQDNNPDAARMYKKNIDRKFITLQVTMKTKIWQSLSTKHRTKSLTHQTGNYPVKNDKEKAHYQYIKIDTKGKSFTHHITSVVRL